MKIKNMSLFSVYVLLFGIWVFFRTTGNLPFFYNTGIIWISSFAKALIIILSIYFIVIGKTKLKDWVILFSLLLLAFTTYYSSRNIDFSFFLLVVLGMRNKDIYKVIKSVYIGMLLGIIFVLFMYLIGLSPDIVQIRLGRVRHSLGFSLPIILPALYYSLVSAFILLKKNKLKSKHILIIVLFSIIIMLMCDGRAPMLLTLLTVFTVYFTTNTSISTKKLSNIFFWISVICLIFAISMSLYFVFYYDSNNIYHFKINEQLTGRAYWWNLYQSTYDINLFGQNILRVGGASINDSSVFLNSNLMILDNGYLSIIFEYGVVTFIIFIILLTVNLKILKVKKDYISLIVWLGWIMYGIVSNQIYFIDRNFALFQFVYVLSSFSCAKNYGRSKINVFS